MRASVETNTGSGGAKSPTAALKALRTESASGSSSCAPAHAGAATLAAQAAAPPATGGAYRSVWDFPHGGDAVVLMGLAARSVAQFLAAINAKRQPRLPLCALALRLITSPAWP